MAQADTAQRPVQLAQLSAEHVTVSARRTDEDVQKVPVAISVVSGEVVADTGSYNLERLTQLQPSLQVFSQNPRNTSINIRGIGAPLGLTNDGIEQGVGVYVDQVTLSLKVKPQITPDDNVIMKLEVHKDSRGEETIAGPSIDTKQVNTEVLVENGGTVSIGGIFIQEEQKTVTKVPLLGDVPLFGVLFRQENNKNDRRELLIFVTPKILRDAVSAR